MDDASAQRLHLSQRPREIIYRKVRQGERVPQTTAARVEPHRRNGGPRLPTLSHSFGAGLQGSAEQAPQKRSARRARRPRTPPGPTTTAPCRQHTPSAREASTLRTSDPRPHPASRRPVMQSLGARAADRAVVGWLLPATRVSELDRPTAASPPMTTRTFVRSPHQQPHSPNRLGTGAKTPLNWPGGLSAIFVNLNRRAATPLGNRVRWFASRSCGCFPGARSRRFESCWACQRSAFPEWGFRVPLVAGFASTVKSRSAGSARRRRSGRRRR